MTVQKTYLQVAINDLQTVINELKFQQESTRNEIQKQEEFRLEEEGKTTETFVSDCLDKANFIINNFFQGNQIHSNDAREISEELYWDMTVFEDRYE